MQTAKMRKYAELSAQIKALEESKAELAEVILGDLKEAGVDSYESKFGKFIRAVRTSYVYSDAVRKLEADLKAAKEKDVIDGKATVNEKEYLTLKAA